MSGDRVRVGITGAGGRMGQALVAAAEGRERIVLSAALEQRGAEAVGRPAAHGHLVTVSDDLQAAVAAVDVLVDFTRPAGTLAALQACVDAGRAMVIGTTGFSTDELTRIAAAAERIPIVMAANFSLGVNLLRALVAQAAQALGEAYDIEIVEAHHRHKVDAPSGTALALGEAAAQGRGRRLEDLAVRVRDGDTGERPTGAIGFATVRGGDVIGDHDVLFLGDGERLSLGHRASSRGTFAHGALHAAAWVHGRAPGRYDMFDVLGIAPPR